jgi:hypothetical protein
VSVSPISPAAIAYVREQATEVMQYQCVIERVERSEDYDEETLVLTPGDRQELYSGRCRIWELSGSASIMVGDADIYQQSTQLSIPWNTTAVIKRYDEVTITAAPTDPQMVGKRYQIQNVAKAGEMRATRRFEVTGAEVPL